MKYRLFTTAVALFLTALLTACGGGAAHHGGEGHDTASTGHEATPADETAPASGNAAPALELANQSQPEEDILSAGQPTEEEISQLADAGYRTILDLRGPDEDRGYDEVAAVEASGMTYVNVPVSSANLDAATFERFFEVMENAERPMVVHCRSANRVGGLYAAYLALEQGLPTEEALARGREAGLRSEELAAVVESYIQSRQDAQ